MLLVPDAFHHELEIRRLDAARVRFAGRKSTACLSEIDLTPGRLREDGFDQLGLDHDRLVGELVVALDRFCDRVARRGPVEMIEAEVVREEARDAALESVELGEGIVSKR